MDLSDMVRFFVLRFIVGTHLYFYNDTNGDELNTKNQKQGTCKQKRFSPYILTHEFQKQQVAVDQYT